MKTRKEIGDKDGEMKWRCTITVDESMTKPITLYWLIALAVCVVFWLKVANYLLGKIMP